MYRNQERDGSPSRLRVDSGPQSQPADETAAIHEAERAEPAQLQQVTAEAPKQPSPAGIEI